jgi:hypothetical protein
MSNAAYVTIGVPVYRGQAFLDETLQSIRRQTHRNLVVVISIDGPDPAAEQLCSRYSKDSRFRVVVQPARLGWVGNLNWLMAQAETPFWYLNAQDDLVDPRYAETLLAHAQKMPEAAVVYSDLVAFGEMDTIMTQSSVTGSAFARQFTLLHDHHAAVAYRGLTRLEALQHAGPIRANEIESFSTDTTWMAAMALWGDLRRVPVTLYHKRYHAENEHAQWLSWPAATMTRAWLVHCADMLEQAMRVDGTAPERRLLWLACVERLLSSRFSFLPSSRYSSSERVSLLAAFFDYLETASYVDVPACLDDDWNDIREWTRALHWSSTTAGSYQQA